MFISFKAPFHFVLLMSLLGFNNPVGAEFCIQAMAFKRFDKNNLPQSLKESLTNAPDARIIKKQGYHYLRIGRFSMARTAQTLLHATRKKFSGAKIMKCTDKPANQVWTNNKTRDYKHQKNATSQLKPSYFSAFDASAYAPISKTHNDPQIDYLIAKKPSIDIDYFHFQQYLAHLFGQNKTIDNALLNEKLQRIKNQIEQDKYNLDFFFSASIALRKDQGDSDTPPSKTRSKKLALNANKRLYDGKKHLIYNEKPLLENRQKALETLQVKEQLLLLGLDIYTNMLLKQELVTLKQQSHQRKQKILTTISKKHQQNNNNLIDKLSLQSDIYDSQKGMTTLTMDHKTADKLFRQSADLKSANKIELSWLHTKTNFKNLADIKKRAIAKNTRIAIEENKFKLNQTDILMQHKRHDWEIDFRSSYGYSNEFSDIDKLTQGKDWGIGLAFKYPIYLRNDISLHVRRAKIEAMQSKNTLTTEQKIVFNLIETRYNQLQAINAIIKLLQKQRHLLRQRENILKFRYLASLADYSTFADAVTKRQSVDEEYIVSLIDKSKLDIELSVLMGSNIID